MFDHTKPQPERFLQCSQWLINNNNSSTLNHEGQTIEKDANITPSRAHGIITQTGNFQMLFEKDKAYANNTDNCWPTYGEKSMHIKI